jgi:hypothetical protein
MSLSIVKENTNVEEVVQFEDIEEVDHAVL